VVADHVQDQKVEEHVVHQVTAHAINQSKKEDLDHQKDENDQDHDQLVLQSLLPQNPDPEADLKNCISLSAIIGIFLRNSTFEKILSLKTKNTQIELS